MRDLARRDFADTDQLYGHVGQSGPDRFGPVDDGLPGQALTRVGITVSAPFGEELDNCVGVATVPGLVVASYDFDRIHGVVSVDVSGKARAGPHARRRSRMDLQGKVHG
jgi:hypothetical protein